MKILVCFEGRVRPDSTGFYLLWAFEKLGHEVTHVTPDKIHEIKPGGHDFYFRCDDGLKEGGWNAALHPSHYYAIDTHIESDWRLELAKGFDTVSVVHSDGLKLPWSRSILAREEGKDLFWIPVGCDPEKHSAGQREKIYDGCAIMNFHNGLAGPRIEALDAFFKACGPIFYGNRTFLDMAEKYAQSKLVFNRSINGDANMRVFEAMASGSCLVTDWVEDLSRLGFLNGVHYVGYYGPGDLDDVTRHLLKNDDQRERIAAAGQKEVLARHQYIHRMESLLKALNLKELVTT